MSCSISPNTTLSGSLQWWQVSDSLAQNILCGGGQSYLRPDVGGARLPWLYTFFAIITHLPVVIIRAVRWDAVQNLSIVLAIVAIAVASQAYRSTRLSPEEILVWSPTPLLLDAGAMLQLFILVVEEYGSRLPVLRRYIDRRQEDNTWKNTVLLKPLMSTGIGTAESVPLTRFQDSSRRISEQSTQTKEDQDELGPKIRASFVILSTLLLFLAILGIQISGLVAAIRGRNMTNVEGSWCSPFFQPFGLTVLDGNCHLHPIVGQANKGLGCINLPGRREQDWLFATIIILASSLFIELVDFIVLVSFSSKFRMCGGLKMKRPWFSMFGGMVLLIVILILGVTDAQNLPRGITEEVWIVMDNPVAPFVCRGSLGPGGLRGEIIAWTDGLLATLRSYYFGIE